MYIPESESVHPPDDDWQALRVGDPESAGYVVRRPIYNRNFNTRDYPSLQVVLSDLEVIMHTALQEKHELRKEDYKVRSSWYISTSN